MSGLKKILLGLLFFSAYFIMPLHAATPAQPAYRLAEAIVNYPWQEGITINFGADEQQCRQHYGRQWQPKCAASLGRYGETVKGVKMTPPAPGYWQWTGPTSMVFVPDNGQSLQPDTAYEIDFSGLYRPSFVKIAANKVKARTKPRSARLVSSDFWIDPSPAARHRLAFSFEFNFPAPGGSPDIEPLVPRGAKFGKPEIVWNPDRDKLNISWPVEKLTANSAQAGVIIKKYGQVAVREGMPTYWGPDKSVGGALFHQNMPGEDGLFRINKCELKNIADENLDRVYELEIETSLYARPEDLLKNIVALELPKYNSPGAVEPYNWKLAPAVSREVLSKARRLEAVPVINGNSPVSRFKFRLPASSGSYVMVTVKKDFASAAAQELGQGWADILYAPPQGSDLGFMQPGNVLPMVKNGKLDIYATNLDAIEWRAQKVRDPFLALVAAASTEAFNAPMANANIDMDNLSTSVSGKINLAAISPGGAQFATLDLKEALASNGAGAPGLMRLTLTGKKNGKETALASRMILATDLGLMIKRSATGELDCFARSLVDGKPAGNASISILGANGRAVASMDTNFAGHARFPSFSGLVRESLPVCAVVEQNGSMAWLPLRDISRELNYSSFDTGGLHTSGTNAFVFGQRGIYRPGEVLHFGIVTRKGDFSLLPQDLPLYAEILDPSGRKIWHKDLRCGEYGINELEWHAPQTALSGRYIINIRTGEKGDIIGSTQARIEEFQPDTLKMKIGIPDIGGWLPVSVQPGEKMPQLRLYLQNLYGTPAKGHKVRAELCTAAPFFRFPGYEDYIFTDAAPFRGEGTSIALSPCETDDMGIAEIEIPRDFPVSASSRITVAAEGFEAGGGRATAAQTSFLVSPMRHILGYRPLESLTNLDFIGKNADARLEFLALNPQLEKIRLDNLKFAIARRHYVTSLVSDGNGGFRYDETPVVTPVKNWSDAVNEKGLVVPLDTSEAGEFQLLVTDGEERELARVDYAVAGDRPELPGTPLASAKLRLRLDKPHYNAGDVIKMAISVPYDGTGLISMERDGVAAFEWFEARAGDCVQSITIPENFEGKGYVVVSFARSPDSSAIYMEPHTFAVAPFTANIRARNMGLRLNAPQTSLPGEELKIKIDARERGKAVIFAIDEGVLQLTGFQTPDPLKSLLGDRALDVRTIQAYDLLMPDHAMLAPRLSAYGGGLDGGQFGKRFRNPFKRPGEPPLASWSTLVPVGEGETEISIPVPDYYNGQIRIMAVGAGTGSAGSTSVDATIAAPLVLTPQMPLFVSPGDSFEGSLIVANTSQQNMKAELTMSAPDQIQIAAPPAKVVEVEAGGEKVVPFRMVAGTEPGSVKVDFSAVTGNGKYTRSSTLSLRPASSLRTSLMAGMADKSMVLENGRKIYGQNASNVASISSLPLPFARSFAHFLETYPHGCTEQLVSRAFAQVLLLKWPKIFADPAGREKLLEAAVGAISSRFNGNGVALWPDGEDDFLLTVYAADFLLAMREAGIGSNAALLEQLCEAIEKNCALNESSLSAARNCAYAIWVLTREGRITTQHLEDLRRAIDERGITGWQTDLAAALMAASQREMHIANTVPFGDLVGSPGGWFDEYAQYSLYTTILAKYFPDRINGKRKNDFFELSRMAMLQNTYSTFSASQGMRALLGVAGTGASDLLQSGLTCEAGENAGRVDVIANGAMENYSIPLCSRWKLKHDDKAGTLFWQIATTGYDKEPPSDKAAKGIEIIREYLDSAGKPTANFALGETVEVRIRARGQMSVVQDCVITDLLPGGFEMVLSRGEGEEDLPQGVKFIDRQEDRMLIFADLSNEPLVFSYKIRPVSSGEFTCAPVAAEAMYNPAISGHGPAGKVKVGE